jgi:N-acetylglutamate synthase-like GNAT family acetyltransferase
MGEIIRLHGVVYAREQGYGVSFEAYVARTFGERAWPLSEGERIWILERDGELVGSMAIVRASAAQAQLRWLLLRPELRGHGVGRELVARALAFCREAGYASVFLWTEGALTAAASLYRSSGFVRTESTRHVAWGGVRTDERYELELS